MLERIIGSKVRTAILRTLFTKERRKVHLREIARLSGLGAPALLREAKMLLSEGLLVEEAEGNRTLYSANVQSALYVPLCDLVAKSEDVVELLRRILAKSSVEVAFVYGSRAKGNARTDSDYDVFVVGDCGLRQLSSVLMPLRDKVGAEINPYVVSREEFVRRRRANDHFLNDVMRGKKIFVKGGPDELGAMEG